MPTALVRSESLLAGKQFLKVGNVENLLDGTSGSGQGDGLANTVRILAQQQQHSERGTIHIVDLAQVNLNLPDSGLSERDLCCFAKLAMRREIKTSLQLKYNDVLLSKFCDFHSKRVPAAVCWLKLAMAMSKSIWRSFRLEFLEQSERSFDQCCRCHGIRCAMINELVAGMEEVSLIDFLSDFAGFLMKGGM